jgi:signal transduction histidine kinase
MARSVAPHSPHPRSTGALSVRRAKVLGGVGLGLAVVTGLIAYTGNDPDRLGAAIVRAALVLLPIAVGLAIWTRLPHQGFGRLLVGAGILAFLAALGGSDDDVVYSIGRVATWLVELALILLVLAFPSGRLHQRTDRVLALGVTVLVAVLFLPTALMTDAYPVPGPWTSCTEGCPSNAFQVLAREPAWVHDIVLPLREALIALVLFAVTLRLMTRIARATTTMRRTLTPVLAGAAIHAATLPVAFGVRRVSADSDVTLTLTWVLASGLAVVALGFLVGAARWRLAVGDGLYRLAPRLHAGTDHETLRRVLAEALEDPTIDLLYRGTGDRWLDTAGRPVTLPAADSRRAYTVISDGDAEVAAILHDEALRDQKPFVLAVGDLALVVLTNQRLTAEVDASLQEVHRSRARILAVADEERRRIERDLHDGAQQRLVALRIKLELASELSAEQQLPNADQLHRFGEEVGEALEDVRSLAAGVYPSLLGDCGLDEALRSIARQAPMPVHVAAQGVGRYPQGVEAAVYFCCLEALQNAAKHAAAGSVSIIVSNDDDLCFEVRDDGCGFDVQHEDLGRGLTNIHDRLIAVGGSLVVESRPGQGTRIAGTIPLAMTD